MEQLVNKLKARLLAQLPGAEAQYRMAPVARAKFDIQTLNANQYRLSAVMILFCRDENDNWFLPLTLRPSYKGAHSGQVSFPGGKADPLDANLQATALRECYEEIGIKNNVELLGSLTQLYIPVSGFLVEPVVGVYTLPNPLFVPHEREVKSIIHLNIGDLMNAESIKQGPVAIDNDNTLKMEAPYFLNGDYKIWGATAMILSELKEVLEPIF